MNLESIGAGGIAGLFIAAISALGINKQLEKKVDKETCAKCSEATNKRLDSMDKKLDTLISLHMEKKA